jgi:hypothetical protein
MRWVLAVFVPVLLAAPVFAAAGDLTLKPCDPRQVGGWSVMAAAKTDISPAPAGCGTVNPAAKVITLRSTTGDKLTVQAALDSAKPEDKVLGLLRIDVTGKGQFKDAPVVEIKLPDADTGGTGTVGPLDVQFACDGRQVPATVTGYVMTKKGGEITYAGLTFGTCLEGQCAFGDKTRTVRIVGKVGNGAGSPQLQVKVKDGVPYGFSGDGPILIGSADGKSSQRGIYGQFMPVDGTWYDIAVSADGKKVTATPKTPTGRIQVDADTWTAFMLDTGHILSIKGDKAAADLPTGKYYVRDASVRRGDTLITLQNSRFAQAQGKAAPVEVAADKTTKATFGTSLKAHLEAKVSGRKVDLQANIADATGLDISRIFTVSPTGTQMLSADPGTLEIFGPDGKLLESGKLVFQ